jgi:hypothetical protein
LRSYVRDVTADGSIAERLDTIGQIVQARAESIYSIHRRAERQCGRRGQNYRREPEKLIR